ncbi:unnamed protein product [Amoebophrya sp. A120]|nr:unnamed protein product [Amoebophrya sp. A120]|eukprot:GSA120T00023607001.1
MRAPTIILSMAQFLPLYISSGASATPKEMALRKHVSCNGYGCS